MALVSGRKIVVIMSGAWAWEHFTERDDGAVFRELEGL